MADTNTRVAQGHAWHKLCCFMVEPEAWSIRVVAMVVLGMLKSL